MKQKFKNTQKGITLVALVITIIVLLILAMVSIKIVVDGGLITKASKATDTHTIGAEKEAIGLGYSEYQMALANKENVTKPTIKGAEVTPKGEGWNVKFTKTNNEYQLSKDGNALLAKQNGIYVIWTDNGDGTFTKGDVTLKVGDYVNYDATKDANGNTVATTSYTSYSEANASTNKNDGRSSGHTKDQVFNLTSYTSGWRVLGVENGNIRLISANIIGPDSGGYTDGDNKYYYLSGKKGYTDGPSELNAISAIYGQGKGATGAKSITVEDINKITGYDPNNTGNGKPFNNGEINQYGNKVTYYWDGTDKPYWEVTNEKKGNLGATHNEFVWYDGKVWQSSTKSTVATATSRKKIADLISTEYLYLPTTLTNSYTETGKGIDKTSNEWKVPFENEKRYWLASNCIRCTSTMAYFCVNEVDANGTVSSGNGLFGSTGTTFPFFCYGIRPVVTIKSDIQIEKTDINDGTTLEKACVIK